MEDPHGRDRGEKSSFFFYMCGPVRREGGVNWASFSGIWWVVVLTTWVGGGAGLDAG